MLYFPWKVYSQVQIGELYYYLSGTSASVAFKTYTTYTNKTYIIPPSITYKGLEYTVTEIGELAFNGSSVTRVVLPNTIKKISRAAFSACKLTSIIIPNSVQLFSLENPFDHCNLLREIIYLPKTAPSCWTATSMTYVPDKESYVSPKYIEIGSGNYLKDVQIIEMITFDRNEFEYTGQPPSTTWKNNIEGYTASLSMPALNGDVGNHEEWIPVTFTKGSETFTAEVVYRYTIKPAKLTLKVSNANREYGEENPQFNISYSGFVSGENESVLTSQPTISTSATKTSNVGEYPITISGGNAANYELVYEPGVLTVTKAPLSAKVEDATKVYGSTNPAFTIEYFGLKNNETAPTWTTKPTFQTEATQSSGVGRYEVKAINGVPMNYDLGGITAGILNISSAPLTIKAINATRQYYNDNPTFSFTCNGFMNGDNYSILSPAPTLSTSATLTSNVGTYEIKVGSASNPNYSISYIDGTLTITPRTLYASVGNYDRLYNEENPVFEVNYDGFVGNEDENVLTSKAAASTTATKSSNVGSYPINVTGGSADNYKLSYTSGTLTINKAEQTISWEQNLGGLKVGDQVELKAVASSGLPITYTTEGKSTAEIYSAGPKTFMYCKSSGQFSIRAVQEGDTNYYSSPRAYKTVMISEKPAILGDMNGDGVVNAVDIAILVNIVLGK